MGNWHLSCPKYSSEFPYDFFLLPTNCLGFAIDLSKCHLPSIVPDVKTSSHPAPNPISSITKFIITPLFHVFFCLFVWYIFFFLVNLLVCVFLISHFNYWNFTLTTCPVSSVYAILQITVTIAFKMHRPDHVTNSADTHLHAENNLTP